MDRPNTLLLSQLNPPSIDLTRAQASIHAMPGCVIVEMFPEPERIGRIYLPESVSQNERPDIGVVIAVGKEEGRDDLPDVGEFVLVSPYDGCWRKDWNEGSYSTTNQVRSYGRWAGIPGYPVVTDWNQSVMATLDIEQRTITPLKNILLIRRDKEIDTQNGIILPDYSKYRNTMGTVVKIGSTVERIKPGDRVLYTPKSCIEFTFDGDEDLALVHYEGIEAVIT